VRRNFNHEDGSSIFPRKVGTITQKTTTPYTLWDEHRSRTLREMFGPDREEVPGENCALYVLSIMI
jgi:hypothetical protein